MKEKEKEISIFYSIIIQQCPNTRPMNLRDVANLKV